MFPCAAHGSRALFDVLARAPDLEHPVGEAVVPDAVVIAVAVRTHLLKRPVAAAVGIRLIEHKGRAFIQALKVYAIAGRAHRFQPHVGEYLLRHDGIGELPYPKPVYAVVGIC